MTSATELVKQLKSFGLEGDATSRPVEHDESLDAEDEEITVGGMKGLSVSEKGKQKAESGAEGVQEKKVSKSLRGLLRTSTHTIAMPGGEKRVLTSWKMADYAYKRDPCPFPTRARGLFTEQVKGARGEEEYRIIARGYDKFFNVNEVSWTKWESIPLHSSAPYELTLKSNGCIILISSLSASQIIVTSKHSLGSAGLQNSAANDTGMSHSQRGEFWLEKHLAKVAKTKEDLAAVLWEKGLTAVAELCDDSFEEHVLAYPDHLTGLHLHGLNRNTPTLNTLPSSEVTTFAKDWGLIPTVYSIFPSVPALRTYCQTVESQGGIEDPSTGKIIPVEGFVVRGKKKGPDVEEGEMFFWKVKYDEPYLMYREWRELTRKLLASHEKNEEVNIKPGKLRNEESRLYLWWVDREIKKDVTKFDDWKKGRGIIKTRDEFLDWKKTPEGRKKEKELTKKSGGEEERATEGLKDFDRTLIVPIAVPGSGKTSLSLSLSHLYGWGHTQSDDFLMKKSGPHFIKSVKELLQQKDVVIADKNNHVRKLRSDLIAAASSLSPAHHARVIGLLWPLDSAKLARDQLHSLYASRIVVRGDNHQTLRAGEGHEATLWKFFGQWESFDPSVNVEDGQFDEVIEMDPEWEKKEALIQVIGKLRTLIPGLPEKSTEEVDEAIKFAQDYKPKVKKELTQDEKDKLEKKANAVRYYGIAVEQDLQALISSILEAGDRSCSIFTDLVESKRIEPSPHVTLVHEVELKSDDEAFKVAKQTLWDHYATLIDSAPKQGSSILDVEVSLGPKIVWDDRCMSIEVSDLVGQSKDVLLEMEGRHAHVTVGTREHAIRPIEGKLLLEAFARGQKESENGGEIRCLEFPPKTVRGKLRGLR